MRPYLIVVSVTFPSENLARTLPTVPDRVPMPKGHWRFSREAGDGATEAAKIVTVHAGILALGVANLSPKMWRLNVIVEFIPLFFFSGYFS